MKVYLAGHVAKNGERDWRDTITYNKMIEKFNNSALIHQNDRIIFLKPQDTIEGMDIFELKQVKGEILASQDHHYMNICDVAVVYLDLNLGYCLGAMWEFGYLKQRGKPVILVNKHPKMGRTKFLEHNADVVVHDLEQIAPVLFHMRVR
jgi:nucleoside 2-deoxyribosyltransferase